MLSFFNNVYFLKETTSLNSYDRVKNLFIFACSFLECRVFSYKALNFSRWVLKSDATCSSSKKLQFWCNSRAANTSDRAGLWEGPGSYIDITFLGTPYFSATFDGFVPESTSVISLNCSVRDNLFLFTVAILSHHKWHINKRSWIKMFRIRNKHSNS